MKTELKPCPFCGETTIDIMIDDITNMDGHIECRCCGIEVRYGDCIVSSVEMWNRRP